jgi:exopolysaccharide biosynthesis polyprenyl glycosylphosphotransferase
VIRRHAGELRALLTLSDALLAVALFAGVSWLGFAGESSSYWSDVIRPAGLMALVYALAWVAALALSGLYRPRFRWDARAEAADILKTAAWVALVMAAFLFVLRPPSVSRLFFLVLFPSQAAVTILSRTVLRRAIGRLQAGPHNTRNVLIVGTGERGRAFARRLEAHPWLGLRIVGFLEADDRPAASLPEGWACLGGLDQFGRLLHELVIDEVAVCVPPTAWDGRIDALVSLAEDEGKTVRVLLGLIHRPFFRGQFDEIDGLPIYSMTAGPDRSVALTTKRLVDMVGAGLGLLLLSPIVALVALAILLRDGRPVLFAQERIGMHGRRFRMFKFRTMVCGAEAMLPGVLELNQIVGPGFQLDRDPRVTKLGRILRKSSLDELPQLWNVFVGEMSIVGPRPAPITEVGAYEVWHRRRLSAKPGITGLAQVEARSYREFDQKANLDLEYIDHWSPWLDFRILIRTVRVLFRTNGR